MQALYCPDGFFVPQGYGVFGDLPSFFDCQFVDDDACIYAQVRILEEHDVAFFDGVVERYRQATACHGVVVLARHVYVVHGGGVGVADIIVFSKIFLRSRFQPF